jgi:hypothetical protein
LEGIVLENLDLMVEIERFMSRRGLTHDDSIESLIQALSEELED